MSDAYSADLKKLKSQGFTRLPPDFYLSRLGEPGRGELEKISSGLNQFSFFGFFDPSASKLIVADDKNSRAIPRGQASEDREFFQECIDNASLQTLVATNILKSSCLSTAQRSRPVAVEVSFIHYGSGENNQFMHRDGDFFEPGNAGAFVSVILLNRENIREGTGLSVIGEAKWADPKTVESNVPLDAKVEFTLKEPFESYTVDDRRCSHALSSIRAKDASKKCERRVIVIRFSPIVELGAARQALAMSRKPKVGATTGLYKRAHIVANAEVTPPARIPKR